MSRLPRHRNFRRRFRPNYQIPLAADMSLLSRDSALADRLAAFFVGNSSATIAIVLAVTALLLLPTFLMQPTEQASQEPGGAVFEMRDRVNDRFPARVHIASYIVEAESGDILRQSPLRELYQNEQTLRESDLGYLLFSGYDVDTERRLEGIYTLADAVNAALSANPETAAGLESATDEQVKEAVSRVLDGPNGEMLRESLSKDATAQAITVDGRQRNIWRAQALSIFVAADNSQLGGGPQAIVLSNDESVLDKERLNRRMLAILRGDQEHYRLWGLALDVNLTSREQGETAIPYIAATVILVLLVVGVTLRSAPAVVLGFFGLLILLVWLKGFSNLIGLNSSLTLDLIVPIAMISLGADFLIHAVARYNEEKARFTQAAHALRAALAGVLGALALASISDGIAFLANITSGIESIIGFGVAAGIAVLSNFVIMGILVPLLIMRLDRRKDPVNKFHPDAMPPGNVRLPTGASRLGITRLIVMLSRIPWAVLPLVALGTAATTYLAFQLEPRFDIKDFLDQDSEFVVGLDKLDRHTAPSLSGEPAIIYIRGDLTAPESLTGMQALLEGLGDNEYVSRAQDGSVFLYSRTIFQLLGRTVGSGTARQAAQSAAGVEITDNNRDGLPDSPEQIRAAYQYMLEHGVPLGENALAYDIPQVREILDQEGAEQSTVITLGILGAREQANLSAARQSLERDLARLRAIPTISEVGLTGSPFTREATLIATTRALTISLPVAAVACFLLLALWMRSVSFAFVTTIPVGLVVSWLYAFMYLTGYSLNFVTATIAAVSIGVGIDYSIHMTQRFRQELPRHPDAAQALHAAASGTGTALAGSAASSIIGFAVMGFAPMPLFSTYGIISAVMVLLAAVASLLVLPSLLLLAARWSRRPGLPSPTPRQPQSPRPDRPRPGR